MAKSNLFRKSFTLLFSAAAVLRAIIVVAKDADEKSYDTNPPFKLDTLKPVRSVVLLHFMRDEEDKLPIEKLTDKFPYKKSREIVLDGWE